MNDYEIEKLDELRKNKKSVCEICDEIYDQDEESKEVKESGLFICPKCWTKKE